MNMNNRRVILNSINTNMDILYIIQSKLAKHLNIGLIPIVIEEMEEDSRYYIKSDYIAISSATTHNVVELVKCLIHEYRHYYQKQCITNNSLVEKDELLYKWSNDFKTIYKSEEERMCSSIEIDSYAFTKYILNKWFDIKYTHYNKTYDDVLNAYIRKYLI